MVGSQLRSLIRTLSVQYQTPVFEPHVSISTTRLEGDRDVLKTKAAHAAQALAEFGPLIMTGEGLDHSNDYFRCVF